jgi:flagellar biosynthesis protein FlhF
MELQRVVARDVRSAFDEVKQRFGEDALVVSNQRVGKRVELIVAVDLDAGKDEVTNRATKSESREAPIATVSLLSQQAFEDALINVTRRVSEAGMHETIQQSEAHIDQHDAVKLRELTQLIKQEFAALRTEFNRATRLEPKVDSSHSELGGLLITHLQETGLPSALAHLLADELGEITDLAEGLNRLTSILDASICSGDLGTANGIHVLLGASGSGKTSFAGRIAQHAAESLGEDKVALISLGDRKQGAWNQLQLIAARVGVTAYRAQNVATLSVLMNDLADCEAIIIDTGNDLVGDELDNFLANNPSARTYLALSGDISEFAARTQLARYDVTLTGVCISRLDSSVLPWPLVAALIDAQVPATCGSDNPSPATALVNWSDSSFGGFVVAKFAAHLESSLAEAANVQSLSHDIDEIRALAP